MCEVTKEEDAAAVVALQRGLPLERRPFLAAGAACGLSEGALIGCARRLLASGAARRLGAVFDARRMGFCSALCAADVPAGLLGGVAGRVAASRRVTHAYERGWPAELPEGLPGGPAGGRAPNFWFTFVAPSGEFAAGLDDLRGRCGPYPLLVLPAARRFKIDVVFDPRTRDRDERVEPRPGCPPPPGRGREGPAVLLSEEERGIVRVLQGALPVEPDLFAAPAARLGMTEDALLERLRVWRDRGVLRRLGLLLRHRRCGFTANGMCCWDAPEGELEEKGRSLAAFPGVTHCYERPAAPGFPFRLYAMIHSGSWKETHERFLRLSDGAGLSGGRLLFSLREFKKTSMDFF